MSDAPLVTVVVPCKAHARELVACLESLTRQTPPCAFETVVVDSAADPDVRKATAGFPGVRFVTSDRSLRAGPARNLGVFESRGDFIAFIDADCQADEAWLGCAVEALMRGPPMVGGPILDALPWHPVAVTDNLLQFADFAARRPEGPARYFPACNMAMRRDAFLAVGGFPEVDVSAGEDTALCDRVLARWPDGLRFVPGMRVKHDGRTAMGDLLRHQFSFGYARGVLGLHMTERHRRWGARWAALPAVIAKRFSYIAARTGRWRPGGVARVSLLVPLLIAGLCAWATGFRRGCRDAAARRGAAGAMGAEAVRP